MLRALALLLPLGLLAPLPAAAASFDCSLSGLAADEQAICDNRDLNDADVRMVTTLKFLTGLFGMGMRGEMMDEQRLWLRQRMACAAELPCLRRAYQQRQQALEAIYEAIERPL